MKNLNHLLFGGLPIQNNILNLIILLVRIFAGLSMMFAGLDKLPLPGWMVEQVAEVGFPFPAFSAWMASFIEFGCGLLLIFGVNTRIVAGLLAFVMAVAAFGSQKIAPFYQIHVAQTYFWLYTLLAVVGAGKFSFDRWVFNPITEEKKKVSLAALPIFLAVLGFALTKQFTAKAQTEETTAEFSILSITVPGSFNDWEVTANPMIEIGDGEFEGELSINSPGPIEFKFAANNSWDYNVGDNDQSTTGMPIESIGEVNGENIKAYIPNAGNYILTLNTNTFQYKLEAPLTNE